MRDLGLSTRQWVMEERWNRVIRMCDGDMYPSYQGCMGSGGTYVATHTHTQHRRAEGAPLVVSLGPPISCETTSTSTAYPIGSTQSICEADIAHPNSSPLLSSRLYHSQIPASKNNKTSASPPPPHSGAPPVAYWSARNCMVCASFFLSSFMEGGGRERGKNSTIRSSECKERGHERARTHTHTHTQARV